MSKPGPPFLSWVGVKPNNMYLPALGKSHLSQGRAEITWGGQEVWQQRWSHRWAKRGTTGQMGLNGTKKGYNRDSGSGRFGNGCGGSSSLFMDQPMFLYLPVASPPYHSRGAPTRCRVHLSEDSKVDDPGCEVKGCLLAIVDHRDAMAVPIAGPGHAALEDGEGQPGRYRRVGVWAGASDVTPGSHRRSWQLGLPCDWPLDRGWEGGWFQVKCPLKVPRRG